MAKAVAAVVAEDAAVVIVLVADVVAGVVSRAALDQPSPVLPRLPLVTSPPPLAMLKC